MSLHKHSKSADDSTFNIRKNPLNIRNMDGTDLVVDVEKDLMEKHGVVRSGHATPRSANSPALRRPESAVLTSTPLRESTGNHALHDDDLLPAHARGLIKSGDTPVVEFAEQEEEGEEERSANYQLSVALGTPDLTSSVMKSYNTSRGLTRQGTIQKVPKRGNISNNNKPSNQSVDTSRSGSSSYNSSSQGSSCTAYTTDQDSVQSPIVAPTVPPKDDKLDSNTTGLDPGDRGRLFLKFTELRDVELPLDQEEKPMFQLVLDNGTQCVTTYPIKFDGKNEIDQEFELVVGDDLRLDVTLVGTRTIKDEQALKALEQQPEVIEEASPPLLDSSPKKKKKKLKELFSSSQKKHKNKTTVQPQPVLLDLTERRDIWRDLVGSKGEFGRTVIVESQVEHKVYGTPHVFTLPCRNEWSRDRSAAVTCGLQVTMMYLPKATNNEELPLSLEQAVKELKQAEKSRREVVSGVLSQQGADCTYWRRRWFELRDCQLFACHDETKEVKKKIDLAGKACKVSDSKNDPSVFESRGFKLTFDDGEYISFLADNVVDKERWYVKLQQHLGLASEKPAQSWIDLVLKKQKEDGEMMKMKQHRRLNANNRSSFIEKL